MRYVRLVGIKVWVESLILPLDLQWFNGSLYHNQIEGVFSSRLEVEVLHLRYLRLVNTRM